MHFKGYNEDLFFVYCLIQFVLKTSNVAHLFYCLGSVGSLQPDIIYSGAFYMCLPPLRSSRWNLRWTSEFRCLGKVCYQILGMTSNFKLFIRSRSRTHSSLKVLVLLRNSQRYPFVPYSSSQSGGKVYNECVRFCYVKHNFEINFLHVEK